MLRCLFFCSDTFYSEPASPPCPALPLLACPALPAIPALPALPACPTCPTCLPHLPYLPALPALPCLPYPVLPCLPCHGIPALPAIPCPACHALPCLRSLLWLSACPPCLLALPAYLPCMSSMRVGSMGPYMPTQCHHCPCFSVMFLPYLNMLIRVQVALRYTPATPGHPNNTGKLNSPRPPWLLPLLTHPVQATTWWLSRPSGASCSSGSATRPLRPPTITWPLCYSWMTPASTPYVKSWLCACGSWQQQQSITECCCASRLQS
jgi:hypothetical protein